MAPTLNNGAALSPVGAVELIPPPPPAPLLDPDELRRQGHQVIDLMADYYARMDDYPVRPNVSPGFLRRQLPAKAPLRPEPDAFESALRDVRDLILPGMTHWQSPRHFAHFPASSSTVAALGEALTAGINSNPFTWTASPAATELEMVVVDWLAKALHLPRALMFCGGGGGTLLGTTCEAILCALVAARDRKLKLAGTTIGDLVVYCSDQTHFAFRKAAHVAGIQRDNCRVIPTCRSDMFALSPARLQAAMQADLDVGLVPLFLCATVGTTQTTLTRRFRALKLWLVLRCYGVEGLRDHVRAHVHMAVLFEKMVKDDARFELMATRRLALVCFRLRATDKLGGEKAANDLNKKLLEDVNANAAGPYMSPAVVSGAYMLRCAVGSTLTEEHHVRQAWKVVQDRAASLLSKMEKACTGVAK